MLMAIALSVSDLTASNGAIRANEDGTYTFTPAANFNGTVALSYNVVDGKGGSVAATQSFSLAAVNDAPALTGTQATLVAGTEDTPYTLTEADLLAGFTDIDGDSLSVVNVKVNDVALTADADGNYVFTPAANFNGSVALSYSVVDGKGGTVAATSVLLAHRRQRCSRPHRNERNSGSWHRRHALHPHQS
jgi:hypothetical protein